MDEAQGSFHSFRKLLKSFSLDNMTPKVKNTTNLSKTL